jgi:hypothetical protein
MEGTDNLSLALEVFVKILRSLKSTGEKVLR